MEELFLFCPTKKKYAMLSSHEFHHTNNEAEYEALIASLKLAKALGGSAFEGDE